MTYYGKAAACGAGSIINAISTWKGAAFALDLHTIAEVTLTSHRSGIKGIIEGGGDTRLIELAVKHTLLHFNLNYGGIVKTISNIPQASGLKSSSAAANAAVLATLFAIEEELNPMDAINIGVDASVEAGVTITGAFDDAAASYLGGVVVTDNKKRLIIRHEQIEAEAVVYAPALQAFSRDVNVSRCRLVSPWIADANAMAESGDYWHAMTLNGIVYSAALGFSPEPMLAALEAGAVSASLSGTGPSYVAITHEDNTKKVVEAWSGLGGKVINTKINNKGAYRIKD
ncbi:MAG: shikimate kinase [Methanosarcinales archaeon]|nr:MAG: shikimate kinase [Methanosarcinales archaeon]